MFAPPEIVITTKQSKSSIYRTNLRSTLNSVHSPTFDYRHLPLLFATPFVDPVATSVSSPALSSSIFLSAVLPIVRLPHVDVIDSNSDEVTAVQAPLNPKLKPRHYRIACLRHVQRNKVKATRRTSNLSGSLGS